MRIMRYFQSKLRIRSYTEERENAMGWLNDEIEKIRRQHQLKQQQEEAQRTQNEQAKALELAAMEQDQQRGRAKAAQLLEPLIQALQLRELMKDVDKIWGIPEPYHPPKKSLNELFGSRQQPSQPFQLGMAWYYTTISHYHQGIRSTQSGMGGSNRGDPGSPSYVEEIIVELRYIITEQRYEISFRSQREKWEDIVTANNHNQIIARLKHLLAGAIYGS